MPSTFLALQIGTSALQASMMGSNIAGHNIANANTTGYSREVADLETANSLQIFTDHTNYLGQGVNGRGADRIDDQFVDAQYRENNTQQSYWQTQSTEINNVAALFNEPTGTTLRQSIDGFFNAWNQLGQHPVNNGARAAVYQASQSLVDAFHTTANALTREVARYSDELNTSTADLNNVVESLAKLNAQIEQAQAKGTAPNDLLDQRNALLDKLSSYANVSVVYTLDATNPSVTHIAVSLNLKSTSPLGSSVPLVTDGTVNSTISASGVSTAGTAGIPNTVAVADLEDQNGSLSSLYDMVNSTNNVLGQVNALALNLAQSVDGVHSAGYGENGQTGNDLFNSGSLTGSNAASSIALNPSITSNSLDLLAASKQNTAGSVNQTDGDNGQAIANQMTTFDQQYAGIVTQLGTLGQAANQQNQTFAALTTQVTQLRQSISGVNINEEMSNLIQYQQSYNAASQFVKVFNDMLTTLISTVTS